MIACHPSVPQRTVLGCGSATTNARCSLAEIRAEKCKIKQAPNLPDWHVAFDVDPMTAQATRRKFYDMAAAERAVVIGFHFSFPSIGYVEKDGTQYLSLIHI